MEIVNPHYKLNEDGSIFSIREKEYESLESSVREILKAAEEIGFTLNDFGIREPRIFPSNELDRTLRKNFVIKLQRGTSEVDLSMSIPKLIETNGYSFSSEIIIVATLVLILIFFPLVTIGISNNWNKGIFFLPLIII